MRGITEQERGEHDALWQDLCDRVYPIRDALGAGDARRMYHQDLLLLTEIDLELDKLRARFRVCLEADFSDRMWLLERIDKIEDEQARRAEEAWPPRHPEEMPARPRRDTEPTLPQPIPGRVVERPNRRLDHDGYGMSREALNEAVQSMLAAIELQYADPAAERVVELEDAR